MAKTIEELIAERSGKTTNKTTSIADLKKSRGYVPSDVQNSWSTFTNPTTSTNFIKDSSKKGTYTPVKREYNETSKGVYGNKQLFGDIKELGSAVVEGAKEQYMGMTSGIAEGLSGIATSFKPKKGSAADIIGVADNIIAAQENIKSGATKIQDQIAKDVAPSTEHLDNLSKGKQLFGRGIGGAAVQIPGMLLAPAAQAAIMGFGAGGGKAKEIRESGGSGLAQGLGGFTAGALEGITEAITGGIFSKLSNEGVKGAIKEMASEFLGEGLSEAVDPFINVVAIKDYELPSAGDIFLNSLEAGVSGAIGSLLFVGIGMGQKARVNKVIKNQNQQSVDELKQAIEAITNVPIPEIKLTQPKAKNVVETQTGTKNVNKMSYSEKIAYAKELGIDSTGTNADLRKRIQAINKPTDTIVQEQQETAPKDVTERQTVDSESTVSPVIIRAIKNKFGKDTNFQRLIDNGNVTMPEASYIENMNAQQVLEEVNKTIKRMTADTIEYDIAKFKVLQKQADKLSMNLQLFAESKDEINKLIEVATPDEAQILKEHLDVLNELDAKGVSTSARKEVRSLINSENSIKGIKAKYSEVLANKVTEVQKITPTLKPVKTNKTITKAKLNDKLTVQKDKLGYKADKVKEVSDYKMTKLKEGFNKKNVKSTKKLLQEKENSREKLANQREITNDKIKDQRVITDERLTKSKEKGKEKLTTQKEQFQYKADQTKENSDARMTKFRETVAKNAAKNRRVAQEKTNANKLMKYTKKFKQQKLRPELQAIVDTMFGDIDTKAKSISTKKLAEMKLVEIEIATLEKEGVVVSEEVKDSISRLKNKQIADMSADEINDLIDIAKHVVHLNGTKNKALRILKGGEIKNISNDITETLASNPSRKALKALEKDSYVRNKGIFKLPRMFLGDMQNTFKTMMLDVGRGNENSAAYKIGLAVEDAQDIEFSNQEKLKLVLNEKIGDYMALFKSKPWNKQQDVKGVQLSSGEKVYLKYAMNDKNVKQSLAEKGARKSTDTKAKIYSSDFVDSIKLNKDEQNVYDSLSEFLEQGYLMLNEEYIRQNNFNLKRSGKKGEYLHKVVSDGSRKEDLGAMVMDSLIKNTGSLKKRVGSVNELVLPDIADIIQGSIEVNSKYNAYAVLNDDLSKVFSNVKVQESLRSNYGIEGSKNGKSTKQPKSLVEVMASDLMKDLQGTKASSRGISEPMIAKIRKNATGAILAFRKTTPFMQTASYETAYSVLDADSLAYGASHALKKGASNEAAKYNQRARVRKETGYDRDTSDPRNKLIQFGMAPIKFMDERTVAALWVANVYQVKKDFPKLKGEAILKKAGKTFNRVLDTQPNYTTANRSMTMRSKSELDKALTMFSSAKSSVSNELKNGYIKYKYTGNSKQLRRSLIAYTISAAKMAAIGTVLSNVFDDKDKDYKEELLRRLASSLPGLNLLSSALDGYDINIISLDTISTLINDWGNIADDIESLAKGEHVSKASLIKSVNNASDSVSELFGVPTENIRGIVQSIMNQTPLKGSSKLYTRPYSRIDYYASIAKAAQKDNLSEFKALVKQAKDYDITKKQLREQMKKESRSLTLEQLLAIMNTDEMKDPNNYKK